MVNSGNLHACWRNEKKQEKRIAVRSRYRAIGPLFFFLNKKKVTYSGISRMRPDHPRRSIAPVFGIWGEVADVVIHPKSRNDRFRVFSSRVGQKSQFSYTLSLSIGLYNRLGLPSSLWVWCDNLRQYFVWCEAITIWCYQVVPTRKLPALYLIDSVIKNVTESNYLQLFTKNIVSIFVLVFEQVTFVLTCYLMFG